MATRHRATSDRPPCERFVVPAQVDDAVSLSFGPQIDRNHWRFDPANHGNIYIVGDVHGCFEELQRLWDRLAPSGDDLVVFVGDLVRKGPASTEVVEFVTNNDHAVSVCGNNEAKIVHDRIDTDPYEEIAGAVESLPLAVSFGSAVVVHGGINPTKSLEAHEPRDLLETRAVPPGNGYDGPFWFERHDGPQQVYFGHTVLAEPYVGEGAIGLDTGCVYGGALTAYEHHSGDVVQVPATKTHQQRSDEKILDL